MVRIKEITLDWFLGHLETVIELLKLPGVDVNAVDHNGNTPLHVAADKGIIFLGPRGPHGIPPLVRPLVSPQEKFGSHIYRLICLMNHLTTHQTSLMAPWDPLNAPLDPLGPRDPPIDPQ